jgi:hypothetical protein
MPRKHRGPAPRDRELFAPARLPALRAAVGELSWLLSRGYADRSALKLVGDRHELTARQRKAVQRCACSDEAREARRARRVELRDLEGEAVHVDGFNALIVSESTLGGGVVLVGRDGAHRDLASVHGTWRRVAETGEVIDALGALLSPAREVVWWLDRPVSNSGRLRRLLLDRAEPHGWPWRVEVVWDPDRELMRSDAIVATGDARILDAEVRWVDLPGALAARVGRRAWLVDPS